MRFTMITLMLIGCAMFCMARDLSAPRIKISGAKVETESAAKHLAFDNYIKKMKGNISATESVRDVAIIVLGYDVGDFVKKGEKIWEARVLTIEGGLRAILWVNPCSEEVHFVCGPWESKKTSE